jgi:signal peptidase I
MRKLIKLAFALIALSGCQREVESRFIPSASMTPTLQIGDRVFVDNGQKFKRLDLISFNSPHSFDPVLSLDHSTGQCWLVEIPVIGSAFSKMIKNPACDVYITRVVALSGDYVSVNPRGELSINGKSIQENYVTNYCPIDENGTGPCRAINAKVPPGYVLALGDNRANSWDGRFWPGGAFLPIEEIRGVVASIYYPPNRARIF